ncbi:jg6632 [Pararge aegeria aegeria]|uniref:Jg6632 protein n=1 Tax=Pararge aegeria aegeria TaxID=348720 RepID=A0A8S4RS94_9NEOP|nr:jg6632 [Pararge aegeria aegeria]
MKRVKKKIDQSTQDENSASASDFGAGLISSLRNDANLDLPVDEEYEDLRAQLFAYHSALASLTPSRRSMLSTQCWRRGGICVSYKLCPGYRQLTEIPGCKNRHNVCCFVWNQYEIRELKDLGIDNLAFPWKIKTEYGGQGVQEITHKHRKAKARKDTESQ